MEPHRESLIKRINTEIIMLINLTIQGIKLFRYTNLKKTCFYFDLNNQDKKDTLKKWLFEYIEYKSDEEKFDNNMPISNLA